MSISLTRDGMYTKALWDHSNASAARNGARAALPMAERTLQRLKDFMGNLAAGTPVTLRDMLKVAKGNEYLQKITGARSYNGITPNWDRKIPMDTMKEVVRRYDQHVAQLRQTAKMPVGPEPQRPDPTIL